MLVRKLFIPICFSVCTFNAVAQTPITATDSALPVIKIVKEPRFLINVHHGYSVGLGSTFKFYPDDVRSITVMQNGNAAPQKSTNYANPTKGLGDGYKFGIGGSYILNDFINLGLDFDYFSSTISKIRDSSFHQTNIAPNTGQPYDEYRYNESVKTSYHATLITLTPTITFKAISKPKWFLYNKLGAIVTFRPNSKQKEISDAVVTTGNNGVLTQSDTYTVKEYDWNIRNPAFGFMGAFGGQIKLSNRTRLFAELQFSHIVFVIRKRTLTDFIVNDMDESASVSVSQRELIFLRSFTANTNTDPNQPSQTLIQRIPITYLGLQMGLSFQL